MGEKAAKLAGKTNKDSPVISKEDEIKELDDRRKDLRKAETRSE